MAQAPLSFEEALARFDRDSIKQSVQLAEQQRQEVVKLFPLEGWPTLPLSRYALGQDTKDCFSWWVEFGTTHIGSFQGGFAGKHIIYKQGDGTWWFDRKSFKSEQEAWESVRSGFLKAFEQAKAGQWDEVDDIPELQRGPALRARTLYIYFPDGLLPICSVAHLKHFLTLRGQADAAEEVGYNPVRLNRLLLANLRAVPEMKDWTTKELERFLYFWAHPRNQPRVVKIAPGGNAEFWDECYQGGYVCIGWDEIGNLREYESKESFRAKFAAQNPYNGNESQITKKANEVWTLRELEPGDLVVANRGTSKVLAVGTVVGAGYEYQADKPSYRHHVQVKWDTSFEQDIPPQKKWAFVTVADVPQWLSVQILSKEAGSPPDAGQTQLTVPDEPLHREIADALDQKRQAILYGPPGTGKTYQAGRFAVWWLMKKLGCQSSNLLADAKAMASAERRLSRAAGSRFWWMVANPKEWSWDRLFSTRAEPFTVRKVERYFPMVRKGDLVIGYQSTPERRIAAIARIAQELHTPQGGEPQIVVEAVARVENGLTFDELSRDGILSGAEPMRLNNQGTLFELSEDQLDRIVERLIERDGRLRGCFTDGQGIGALTRVTFHPSYSYEDFVEGFRPVDGGDGRLSLRLEDGVFKRVCREALAHPDRPYLVLIDEINRANVAKVFGELITLLEKDKRGVQVMLPQSKQTFVIPDNVYVLGTMNTADRSIKLLDTALRRRFAFLELMPDLDLLEGHKVEDIALDQFLRKLNHRIAKEEGREKQIGHSYLMHGGVPVSDPEEFVRRFRQEILPLLQEYCYDDYSVLSRYIGTKLVKQDAQVLADDILGNTESLIEALEEEFAEPVSQ